MEYKKALERAIIYIENHLSEDFWATIIRTHRLTYISHTLNKDFLD